MKVVFEKREGTIFFTLNGGAFNYIPGICAGTTRRICEIPKIVDRLIMNFCLKPSTRAIPRKNQPGMSKQFTITKPRESLLSDNYSRLREFRGTLEYDFEKLLAEKYQEGYRYMYLAWKCP